MGKISDIVSDALVSPIPDRNANRIRAYRKENGEVVIHFRDLKIMLLSPQEIAEWSAGFGIALDELRKHDYLKNDL